MGLLFLCSAYSLFALCKLVHLGQVIEAGLVSGVGELGWGCASKKVSWILGSACAVELSLPSRLVHLLQVINQTFSWDHLKQ